MARKDLRNHSRYWRVPGIVGIDLMQADFTTHDYAPHVHDSLVIAVTEAGGSEFKSRGKVGQADESALLVFNPGEPHSGRMGGSEHWKYRAIYLDETGMAEVLKTLGDDQPRYFTQNTIADPQLIALSHTLMRALDGDHDPLLQQELLVSALGELFSRYGGLKVPSLKPASQLDALRPTLALMHDGYCQPLPLARLAAVADLTPLQLIKAFKQVVGLTPHSYLNQIRLRAAMRFLKAGGALAEAAIACGFYDQSALNHHFKRTFGVTPMQFIRAL